MTRYALRLTRREQCGSIRAVSARYRNLAARYDRWWQRYTERTLTAALEALQLSGTERILDAGCGTGEFERLALARFPGLRLVGIDVTQELLAIARRKLAHAPHVRFNVAQAEALPSPADTFDAVVSASVLHHLDQPQRFIKECARVLRAGGRLVIVDWCADFWRCRLWHPWLRLTDRSYVAMYGLGDLTRLVERSGLSIASTDRFTAPPWYGMMRLIAVKMPPSPR